MIKRHTLAFASLALFTSLLCSLGQASTVNVGAWTPLYQGVDYATGSISGTDRSAVYGLRVDLTAPGISFLTTPAGGTLNTVSETTSQFVERSGVQVAINANFFSPCCDPFPLSLRRRLPPQIAMWLCC